MLRRVERLTVWPFLLCAGVVAMTAAYAQALDCPPCDPASDCKGREKTDSDCEDGTVPDACFCCCVCGRGLSELCGGPWDAFGRCGRDLWCYKNLSDDATYTERVQAVGICVPSTGKNSGGLVVAISHKGVNV